MKDWNKTRLKEVAEIQTGPFGSQLHKSDYIESGTPIITVEHLGDNRIIHVDTPFISDEDKDRLDKYSLEEDDIVFSRVGSVDRRAIVRSDENGWLFSGRCLRVRFNSEKVSPKYVSYYFGLESFKQYIRGIAVGATMPSLNTKILSDIEIPLPPLPTQRKIADILSALDDKIENNRKVCEKLEEIAAAVFRHWFVDFEFPDAQGKPYKSSGGRMVESELGLIPEGWEVGEAQEFYLISIGKTPPRVEPQWFEEKKSDNNIRWVSIKDMGDSGVFICDTSEYLTRTSIGNFNVKTVEKDTVILSFKLTIGRVAIASETMTTNEAIAHFMFDNNIIGLREYTYLMLKSYNYAGLGSTSSIASAINSKIIKGMDIVMPKIDFIRNFGEKTKPIFDLISNFQKERTSLQQTRDALLPKLISGELSVEEMEV